MPRYQSKSDSSIQVEAFLMGYHPTPGWYDAIRDYPHWPAEGDWIVKNPNSDGLYVVTMDDFCKRYTLVREGEEKVEKKSLHNTNVDEARQHTSDIQVYGEGNTFALWCKVSSEQQGWMKSTKVANVPGGALVQVTTQQRNPDGSYAVAEALTFVPYVWLDTTQDPPQMVAILDHPTLLGVVQKSE